MTSIADAAAAARLIGLDPYATQETNDGYPIVAFRLADGSEFLSVRRDFGDYSEVGFTPLDKSAVLDPVEMAERLGLEGEDEVNDVLWELESALWDVMREALAGVDFTEQETNVDILCETLGSAQHFNTNTPEGMAEFVAAVQDEEAAAALLQRIKVVGEVIENRDDPLYITRWTEVS